MSFIEAGNCRTMVVPKPEGKDNDFSHSQWADANDMTRKTLEIEMSHQSCAERVQRKSSVCFFTGGWKQPENKQSGEPFGQMQCKKNSSSSLLKGSWTSKKDNSQSLRVIGGQAHVYQSVVLLTLHADGHHAKRLIKSPMAESENSFEAPPKKANAVAMLSELRTSRPTANLTHSTIPRDMTRSILKQTVLLACASCNFNNLEHYFLLEKFNSMLTWF